MQLTTEEVALAGVLIGALIGSLSASLRDRSNSQREHGARLWEKEVEIYESLLLQSQAGQKIRSDLRLRFQHIPDWKLEFEFGGLDELTQKRLPIQLEMFGRPDVQSAYEECDRLLKEQLIALARLVDPGKLPAETQRKSSKVPEDYNHSREELIQYWEDLFRVLDAADEADDHLTEVISTAVRRVPISRRGGRLFKRQNLTTSVAKIDLNGDQGGSRAT
jgi:hypothetical protein